MRWIAFLAAAGLSACTMPIDARSGLATGPRARLEVLISDSTADNPAEGPWADRSFEMVLTNVSKRPLWVAARIGYEGPSPTQGRVELSGPSGALHRACMACKGVSPAYVVLRPGEQLRTEANLWCFGRLVEPGVYTLEAVYSPKLAAQTYSSWDDSRTPPAPPDGVDLLTEDIVAEPVRFRLRAPPP